MRKICFVVFVFILWTCHFSKAKVIFDMNEDVDYIIPGTKIPSTNAAGQSQTAGIREEVLEDSYIIETNSNKEGPDHKVKDNITESIIKEITKFETSKNSSKDASVSNVKTVLESETITSNMDGKAKKKDKSSASTRMDMTVERTQNGRTHLHLNRGDTGMDLKDLSQIDSISVKNNAGVHKHNEEEHLAVMLEGHGDLGNLNFAEEQSGNSKLRLNIRLPSASIQASGQSSIPDIEGTMKVSNLEISKHGKDGRFEVSIIEHLPISTPAPTPSAALIVEEEENVIIKLKEGSYKPTIPTPAPTPSVALKVEEEESLRIKIKEGSDNPAKISSRPKKKSTSLNKQSLIQEEISDNTSVQQVPQLLQNYFQLPKDLSEAVAVLLPKLAELSPFVGALWTDWGTWSTCSSTCDDGSGTMRRERYCVATQDMHCEGPRTETTACSPPPPPCIATSEKMPAVSESVLASSEWSACSVTCGVGMETRTKPCAQQDATLCQETRKCIRNSCNPGNRESGVEVQEGDKAVLHCKVSPSLGIKRLMWVTPEGKDLSTTTNSTRVSVLGHYLLLHHARDKDQGVYHCVALLYDGQKVTGDAVLAVSNCNSAESPCHNGGTCHEVSQSEDPEKPFRHVRCQCMHGYKGDFCEIEHLGAMTLVLMLVFAVCTLIVLIVCICWCCIRSKANRTWDKGAVSLPYPYDPPQEELKPLMTSSSHGYVSGPQIDNTYSMVHESQSQEPVYMNMELDLTQHGLGEQMDTLDAYSHQAVISQSPALSSRPSANIYASPESGLELSTMSRRPTLVQRVSIRRKNREASVQNDSAIQTRISPVQSPEPLAPTPPPVTAISVEQSAPAAIPEAPTPPPIGGTARVNKQSDSASSQTPVSLMEMMHKRNTIRRQTADAGTVTETLRKAFEKRGLRPDYRSSEEEWSHSNYNTNCNPGSVASGDTFEGYSDSDDSSSSDTTSGTAKDNTVVDMTQGDTDSDGSAKLESLFDDVQSSLNRVMKTDQYFL